MIDLTQTRDASPAVQTCPIDPGVNWCNQNIAIDAPPDDDVDPAPEAQWSAQSKRTGICGVVSPRVVALPSGIFRMYYTQILPHRDFPQGANDYDHATTRILSATSSDGISWFPEAGIRLSPREGGAGEFRVVSSEVVPRADGVAGLRMYYECCDGPQSKQNSIRSAVSEDGLVWIVEAGVRLEFSGQNLSAPRILFLEDGRCRLFCSERGTGMISAVSVDGGVTFHREAGIRIAPDATYDRLTAFAPEILRLSTGGYRMYYAGYSSPARADILTATSDDGLNWQKAAAPVLSGRTGIRNAVKCSEMCVIRVPWETAVPPKFRMLYEECDGTAENQRGVWRIASAIGL
ncbi:MAG: hypothetical protein KDB01_20695 [Planctomycetaceae bacterium]|nr:hypothetical protein [Planctomycetaceae bacterium]